MRYVAGAGVVNCDILYSGITRLPSEGEEIFSTGFDLQLGGGVPGIMVNLARLGVPVKFSTYLGNDFFSQFVKNQLEQFGVHYVNLYSGTGMPVNVTSVVITPKDRTFISHRDDFGYNDTMKQQLFEQLRGASIIRMSNHLYEVYSRIKQENPDTIFVMDTGWDDTMSLDSYAKYLELADYYGRENIDATETLRLLYQSLRALLKPSVPNRLVKPVYELKLMEINGEYRELPLGRLNDSTLYAWQYVLAAPVESLYTFTLTDQVLGEFVRCVEQNKERFIDKTFHSLDILNAVMDNAT